MIGFIFGVIVGLAIGYTTEKPELFNKIRTFGSQGKARLKERITSWRS
jgi:hypothetical protein